MKAMRESPWGPLAVADAHVHFFSRAFFSKMLTAKPALTPETACERLGWTLPPEEPTQLTEAWVKELDRHGIERSALIASVPGDEASVSAALKLYPNRFFAFAMVNPFKWQAEAFSDVHIACLFPAMHRFSVHDKPALEIFEWAHKNRRAVFVHCGVLSVGVRGKL